MTFSFFIAPASVPPRHRLSPAKSGGREGREEKKKRAFMPTIHKTVSFRRIYKPVAPPVVEVERY